MESSRGYWRRYVLPKIDLETGRAEYRGALPKVLASFGVANGVVWEPPPEGDGVKPKGKGRKGKGGKTPVSTTITGADDVKPLGQVRLYPAGKRLLKPERNLAMAHAPRSGEDAFCWDWYAHSGCSMGAIV